MNLLSRFTIVLPLALIAGFSAVKDAKASPTLAASLGLGYEVDPLHQVQATNIMVAPGYSFGGMLRLELGIVGSLQAARAGQASDLGLEFRPMLVVSPPLFPLYGRLVAAAVNPFSSTRTIAYGGAVGFGLSVAGLGLFAEAGLLPRSVNSVIDWIVEGRLGVTLGF